MSLHSALVFRLSLNDRLQNREQDTQAKFEEQWTVFGLAQELGVHRNWLYTRIRNGTLPATRHTVVGHYLIPDDPELLATLRAQRDRCCYR